jgi:hypothetical protein
MNDQKISPSDNASSTPKARRQWDAPRLTRIRAGEAETGANPANPEAHFGSGS